MGPKGQGRGGRADEQQTNVRFTKERTPVHTTKGALISKMFVDGEQVRGEVSTEAVELISSAERDATDAINKNKIPNQYRGPIKEYFSQMRRRVESGETPSGESEDSPK